MTEVLGQRSLLGFGVLLAWLVLFHLLVNIWLLCVFTSLLVVLGGWLGSQAVLESNNMVHLERFITLEQVPYSVKDEQDLDQEIHNTVRKIIRDFVASWYTTVSSESGFEKEVQDAMISMAMELKIRARQVDRKELTQKILDLFGCHLQDFLKAKEVVMEQQKPLSVKWSSDKEQLWKAYSTVTAPHLAMSSNAVEVNYTRAFVDLLLHILVPSPHLETRTGRFVVGELITCNVLLPLIDKLSDPDWLNLFMIEIFGKSSVQRKAAVEELQTSALPLVPAAPTECELPPQQETVNIPQTNIEAETEMLDDVETATPELAAYDVIDSEELDGPQNTEEEEPTQPFLRHYLRGSKSNPFYRENDSDLDSPLTEYKRSSIDSLVMIGQDEGLEDRQKECAPSAKNNGVDLDVDTNGVDGSCPKVLVNSQPLERPSGCGSSLLKAAESAPSPSSLQDLEREGVSPSFNPSRELLLGIEQTVSSLGSPSELTVISPLQGSSPMPSFSFEPLSSPDGPVIIQNLRITGTITAKEHRGTGSHPYTLYTIKDSDSALTGSENPSPVQPVAYHMVNRRYSEFLNLQTRLEEKAELRKLIKGVKGPKKIFPDMPFGNMDSDKIEARKGLLETFLKQLCAIPEIANSEEMQEFLALNTDARIAFVKKPFITSRIDKIVVNAIVDTLKTAFPRSEPQSPTEDDTEVDGGKLNTDKKNRSRLKFSGKTIPLMNGSDIRPTVLFSLEQTSTVSYGQYNRPCLCSVFDDSHMEVSVEMLLFVYVLHYNTYELCSHVCFACGGTASETALAEVALNILCLLMKEQWSWLCTENIQKAIRLLFGTFINRWLDVSVANLTCTRYWVTYLQVIQEAVWPGGTLPTTPQRERSQQQKDVTKEEALHCLMRLLPDLVSEMLGSVKYKLSWQTALESLQDPYINRLIYSVGLYTVQWRETSFTAVHRPKQLHM
uniref:Sorting nexin 19b n=1 Tax=Sphaeramia orbicularis TaxID=375764 RepID=A0A673BWB9_9TELE